MSSEWSATRLRYLVSIKHGFAFKGEFFVDEETPLQLTTPGNFAIGGGFQYGKGKYYAGPVPSDYVLQTGDLIVTMTDLSKAADTLGYAAVVPNGTGTTWLHNQRVGLVRPQEGVNVHMGYIHYLMRSPDYRHWVVSTATGSTVKHTSPDRILSYEFLLPSLAEQREIGETLATLDDRISLLRQTNATLEAVAQALFKSWFVDFDPVRAKAEGRQPEGMDAATATLFPDSFEESELGLVPKGWMSRSIYDMATYINGAAYKAFEPNADRRGLPIIKIAELKAGVSAQTAFSDVSMPAKYLIETGDILFSWSGNPDTSIDTFVWQHAPALLNQHIFRVLPHESFERSFVLQMLRNLKPVFAELARNKQTTGLGHVTVADMKRLQVVYPPMSVIEQFNTLAVPIHQMIFGNDQQAQTLTQLRDTLLPRLISGQLRLPEAENIIEGTLP
ncbi:restriction endonuclease subunit S [Pseudomonas tohonis]|uniref:restriction endonuclease subunit S n=1 Tax=Pseudomonas tohonis TaxID=2725477 RepID=UPI0021D95004|nr:restriction endonuclease subunit S [Pseudomonas tohonis]UXY54867.1 restriction endonuclease subunit S [Pseudomonas tohonis]